MPTKIKKYNHLFDMAFSVDSLKENPEDIPADELLIALMRRVADIAQEVYETGTTEWAGNCSDSYEVD